MSWLDSIIDVGKSAVSWFTGDSATSGLARSALTAYSLNQVTKSINRQNQRGSAAAKPDAGVRIQLDPNPNSKIPVVYGRAAVPGLVSDAHLSANNLTMFFCLTICEQTGAVDLGAGAASAISFKDIYWNNQRLIFETTGAGAGYVVVSAVDESGAVNTDVAGQIQVFCYSGSSDDPVLPQGYTNAATSPAYSRVPTWTSAHTMDDLIFAVVRIDYDRAKNVTALGNMTFVVENTMSRAGDCIFDYSSNTRYGAGIDPQYIFTT